MGGDGDDRAVILLRDRDIAEIETASSEADDVVARFEIRNGVRAELYRGE